MQNPIQMIQMLKQVKNNPVFKRAEQMTQGKNEDEIKQVVKNIALQRGIPDKQLQEIASMFGLKM